MEDNLKRIVSEVTRLSREAGVEVDANVIGYTSCLQEVQKSWDDVTGGASLSSGAFGPALIASLSQLLYKVLHQKDSPYIATAKMQIMMEVAFKNQREAVEKEQSEGQEEASMLARSITGAYANKNTTMQAYEKLHKLIIEYICKKVGLDRALSDEFAGEEVRAAVESVFPLSSLARFLTLEEAERLQQIEELSRITLGICLFNRHTGKGGRALPPATETYMPQAQRLQRDLNRQAQDLAASLRTLQAFQAAPPSPSVPSDEAAAASERARLEAINVAQAFATFQQLSADLNAGLEATQQLDAEVQHTLLQVQDSVGSNAAISKDIIYPLFDRLGTLQIALVEELRLLVVRQRLYEEASSMLGGYTSMLPSQVKVKQPKASQVSNPWISKLQVPSAAEQEANTRIDSTPLEEVPIFPEGYEYISTPADLSPQQAVQMLQGVSLSGFCAVSLSDPGTSSGPVLRLVQPSLGLVKVEASGELIGFSSAQAVSTFSADPAAILEGMEKAVLKQPLLAKLLGRTHLHTSLQLQTVVDILSGPLKVDFGSQTPVHFLERHIDYSYEWNEWALRRRVLSLANLRQKCTHGTQTTLTHFKRDGDTQVWLPKEAQVQTRVNKGQSMPKKLQYVAGLRGSPHTKMNVIRLDLDLGQPHQY
ncbi:hypothetical protein CEUSTIGMA_g437.t1 [Chlamydomonas eustigma]|uniref:Cilia- and flagella-associated protein 206 n=1 Tax=Chlamydomonas eustigma TaxID=1157962 RepID=A0A250WQ58_9CHLO|nr:hypothetical protein CEUSTIGMA_g437.t1 [Chlamydomonas eustigma]|eukprot:GAX72985.1 hypothetical protein CEUSTIGMA_g437.t1 [Chlamydomonas eustigma]